jgi:hypothetical protein
MWNGSQWLIGGNTSAGAGYIAYSTNNYATAWTRVTSPIATRVTGLAYNGSRTVAVGNGSTNTLAYSDDFGATWTGLGHTLLPNNSNIHRVEWHNNKFIVTGTNASGIILYSVDGVHWKSAGSGGLTIARCSVLSNILPNIVRFTANGVISANYVSFNGGANWNQMFNDNINIGVYNGKYAVFGAGENGNCYVAYDLMSAFKITTAITDASGVQDLKWNGEHWLMAGKGALLKSYDGFNWTPVATEFVSPGYWVTGLDWHERWIASVQTGATSYQIIYSSDGTTWSLASTSVGGGPVKWTNNKWIAHVYDASYTKVALSQDGISWTTQTIGSYGPVLSMACDDNGTIVLGTYPGSTSVEAILRSSDGTTWTAVGGTNQNWHHYGAIWDGLRFYFKTDNSANSIRQSIDAITWTSTGGNLPGKQLTWTNPHKGAFTVYQPTIACGTHMAYSKDGIFYKSLGNSLFTSKAISAEWNGTLWIAGGQGATNTLAYSYDGTTWTGLGNTIFTQQCNKVKWNGTMWVAVGEGTNTLAISINGTTWTGLGTSIFDASGLAIAFNTSTWLAGGNNGLAYSTDGIVWTVTDTSQEVRDILWLGNRWIIAGPTMKYTTVASGQSGWTNVSVQPFSTRANAIMWNGQTAVAVGEGGNSIASSTDLGTTWTGQGTSVFARGNAIAWNDKRWIAGGTTIAFSDDGANWTTCKGALPSETFGIGANSKIGTVPIRSAITLNNRDKVSVVSPKYYDVDIADDTSLVFNLAV